MSMKQGTTLPIILIILGSIWLMKSTALLPDAASLLALLLICAGFILLATDGLNKSTLVNSPMLIYAGAAIYFYETGRIKFSTILALGMVLLGVLLLIVRNQRIPERAHRYPPKPLSHTEEKDHD